MATLVIAGAVASCNSLAPTQASTATPIPTIAASTQLSASPTPSLAPSGGPSPSPVVGQVVGGLPTSVDGRPVYLLADAAPLMVASTRDVPLLVGGWFHSPGPVFFCTFNGDTPPWGPCLRLFLFAKPTGQLGDVLGPVWQYGKAPNLAFAIYPGDPPAIDARTAYSATRPVVLSVHTHDPGCATGQIILAEPCTSMLVMDAVVWFGPPIT